MERSNADMIAGARHSAEVHRQASIQCRMPLSHTIFEGTLQASTACQDILCVTDSPGALACRLGITSGPLRSQESSWWTCVRRLKTA